MITTEANPTLLSSKQKLELLVVGCSFTAKSPLGRSTYYTRDDGFGLVIMRQRMGPFPDEFEGSLDLSKSKGNQLVICRCMVGRPAEVTIDLSDVEIIEE